MTWQRECGRKIRWRSAAKAWAMARRWNKKGDDLHVYRCRFCGYWHCGHPPVFKEART